ncbi:GNAT family N-acetyltransferase [Microbacterium sp. KSW4-11]|uniref:GNAT family N-acetyltransferase n=1 Tax=Microbacterium gawkjiense TaxID=3067309 RepID=A0ABU3G7Q9_9MICO|nr:GNAT family N-acetyltransferase [Microbacterium sp. KSW4-11]MDT3315851.1 GNAT family N-acetyltransferase [Microbacterium sp. KSW4-11]
MTVGIHLSPLAEIPPATLYRILWLRVSVFVVEQQAAYPELDGRDIEPGALIGWAEEGGEILGTLRLLDEREQWRIGRVVTSSAARGRGVGADLMRRAIDHAAGLDPARPFVLDAQEHLAGWYGRFGFVTSGPSYIEDRIPHVPMTRAADAAV